MTKADDLKAALLAPRGAERPVDVAGVGKVTVRGLTRAEVVELREVPRGPGGLGFEQHLLAVAMIDPVLTVEEVAAWQKVAPTSEFDLVVDTVTELSGLGPGRAKEVYKELAGDSDAEFRDAPGP